MCFISATQRTFTHLVMKAHVNYNGKSNCFSIRYLTFRKIQTEMVNLKISAGAAFPFGIPRRTCGDGVKIVRCSWQVAENTIY